MQIFVTETHTRMALAVVRELGRGGHEVYAVVQEGLRPLGGASRFAAGNIVLPAKDYASALLKLGEAGESVLLPTGMATLNAIAQRHDEFAAAFKGLFCTKDVMDTACDKGEVAAAARGLGLLVPEDYTLDAPRFPCVLKYKNGEALGLHAAERYIIVHEEKDFCEALNTMKLRASRAVSKNANENANADAEQANHGEIFAAQYIAGGGFGVGAVLDEESRPAALFCHRRVREFPISGGPASLAEAVWHEKMIEHAVKLLHKMKLKGFAMVEFKGTPDAPYVLEINPRVWGTYPLSYICGAGMANAYVTAALGKGQGLDYSCVPPWVGKRMQYLPNDLAHLVSRIKKRQTTAGNPLWDMICPLVRGGVFSFGDLPGSMKYAANLLKKGGKKGL